MGIVERANILKKSMNKLQVDNLEKRLHRLLDREMMGDLFKVIFAFKSRNKKFFGFE